MKPLQVFDASRDKRTIDKNHGRENTSKMRRQTNAPSTIKLSLVSRQSQHRMSHAQK